MNKRKAIAIAGGSILALGIAGYFISQAYAKQQQGGGGGGGGGAGGCPPGTQWSKTCQACVPPPQQCPCDAVWDECLGQCSKLIPAVIDMPAEYDFTRKFLHIKHCKRGEQCKQPYQGGDCGCYSYSWIYLRLLPYCVDQGGFHTSVIITGKVLDSAGKPICNIPLEFEFPSQQLVHFTSNNPQVPGPHTVYLSGEKMTKTGVDGSFAYTIFIDYDIDMGFCFDCATLCSCINSYWGYLNIPVKAKIPGTAIASVSLVKVYLWHCFAYDMG
jgi:hypothetical protein